MTTPCLHVRLDTVRARLQELRACFPHTAIHYAVKANPHPRVLETVRCEGGMFDVASPQEVGLALQTGAAGCDLLYSNPVKSREHIAVAFARGVRMFVVDSPSEVDKLAAAAPGAAVLCRVRTSGAGSDWPLSRKFGCSEDDCLTLLRRAASIGLDAAGVAFHVGSQQHDPRAWREPVQAAGRIFTGLHRDGLAPWLLDLGGGLPARLDGDPVPPLSAYAEEISDAIDRSFGSARPRTILEPGRGIVADAGVLHARVIAVLRRDGRRWVFLDAGVFTGLVETLDEAIRYRLETDVSGPLEPAVLAGPSCDSADVLYERTPVLLPAALREDDVIRVQAAGAYTSAYTTSFNGFDPLRTVIHDDHLSVAGGSAAKVSAGPDCLNLAPGARVRDDANADLRMPAVRLADRERVASRAQVLR